VNGDIAEADRLFHPSCDSLVDGAGLVHVIKALGHGHGRRDLQLRHDMGGDSHAESSHPLEIEHDDVLGIQIPCEVLGCGGHLAPYPIYAALQRFDLEEDDIPIHG
jgi:hypothetical protein